MEFLLECCSEVVHLRDNLIEITINIKYQYTIYILTFQHVLVTQLPLTPWHLHEFSIPELRIRRPTRLLWRFICDLNTDLISDLWVLLPQIYFRNYNQTVTTTYLEYLTNLASPLFFSSPSMNFLAKVFPNLTLSEHPLHRKEREGDEGRGPQLHSSISPCNIICIRLFPIKYYFCDSSSTPLVFKFHLSTSLCDSLRNSAGCECIYVCCLFRCNWKIWTFELLNQSKIN